MENFTKAFLMSLLMGGSFMINAAEYSKEDMARMAGHLGLSVSELHVLGQQMPLADIYAEMVRQTPQSLSNRSREEEERAALFGMTPNEYRKHLAETEKLEREEKAAAASFGMSLNEYRNSLAAAKKLEDTKKAARLRDEKDSLREAKRLQAEFEAEEVKRREAARSRDEKDSLREAKRLQAEFEAEEIKRREAARSRAEEDSLREVKRLQAEFEAEEPHREEQKKALRLALQLAGGAFEAIPARLVTPVKDKIQDQTRKYRQSLKERPILEKYMIIFNYLNGLTQHSDVHGLDHYLFGPERKINTLLEVGRLYGTEAPVLTLRQVGEQMVSFVNGNQHIKGILENADFVGSVETDGQVFEKKYKLTAAQIMAHLNAHFSNMDAEILNFVYQKPGGAVVATSCPEARELWSRFWTLASRLYTQDDNTDAIITIVQQALEGHLSDGGCVQGRIDRGFVGYVSLLGKVGVNL